MKDGTDWDDRKDEEQVDVAAEVENADADAQESNEDLEPKTDEFDVEAGEEEAEDEAAPVFGPTPVFGNARDLINRYSHCVVCHSRLHFTHMTDFSRNLSQETAKCPECNLKVRRVTHRLQ
jgi:hypothetical protein